MATVTNTARLPRKTKPKGRHPVKALSAAFLCSAPPGRHADGNGLFLFVQPSGTRSWIQRLVIRGRRRELGLGSVALVSLAEGREKALANRKLARQGGDPLAEKRRTQGIPTFAEAAPVCWNRSGPAGAIRDTSASGCRAGGGSTTPATGSARSWAPNMTLSSTCKPCPMATWLRSSGPCGNRQHRRPCGWRSSSWC